LFADLVASLYWWQPLVWLARRRWQAASELAADEASLLVPDGAGLLAGCLVELGGRLAGKQRAGWVQMAGTGFRSGLGQRVQRLLHLGQQPLHPVRQRILIPATTVGLALVLAATLSFTAWARPEPIDKGGFPMTMRQAWQRSVVGLVLGLLTTASLDLQADEPPDSNAQAAPMDQAEPQEVVKSKPIKPIAVPVKAKAKPVVFEIKKREFNIPIKISKDRQEAIENLILWVSSNKGEIWSEAARITPDTDHFTFKAEEDGLYWFAVGILNKDGTEEGNDPDNLKAALHVKVATEEDKEPAPEQPPEEQPPQNQPPQNQPGEEEPAENNGRSIKVFRLKNIGADEMVNLLKQLLDSRNPAKPGAGAPEGTPELQKGGMPNAPTEGTSPDAGTPEKPPRIAASSRTRAVVVQGSARDLRLAANLVKLVDAPPGKALPKVKDLTVFRLKHAEPEEITELLGHMDLKSRFVALTGTKILVVAGPEEEIKEIKEVVRQLDVVENREEAETVPGNQ
jgi:hypothetical protein